MRAVSLAGVVGVTAVGAAAAFHVYVAGDLAKRGMAHDLGDVLPISAPLGILAALLVGLLVRLATGRLERAARPASAVAASPLGNPIRTYWDVRRAISGIACVVLGPVSLLWGLWDFAVIVGAGGWGAATGPQQSDALLRTGAGVVLCLLGAIFVGWEMRKARQRAGGERI
jgi:hypothetical protein